jgi:hypothetical protein
MHLKNYCSVQHTPHFYWQECRDNELEEYKDIDCWKCYPTLNLHRGCEEERREKRERIREERRKGQRRRFHEPEFLLSVK